MMEMEPDLVDDVALGDGGAMLDALMMLVDDAAWRCLDALCLHSLH